MLESRTDYIIILERKNGESIEVKYISFNEWSYDLQSHDNIQNATWFKEEELEELKDIVSSRNRLFKRRKMDAEYKIKKQTITIEDVADDEE